MIVSDFAAWVGRVGGGIRMEIYPAPLTITPDPLAVHYDGTHSGARSVAPEGVEIAGLNVPIDVPAKALLGVISLFSASAELKVQWKKPNLVLASGERKAVLRAGLPGTKFTKTRSTDGAAVVVDAREVGACLRFLVDVSTRDASASPVLTGVNVRLNEEQTELTLEATDSRRAGITVVESLKAIGTLPPILVTAVDLDLALQAMDGKCALLISPGSGLLQVYDRATSYFLSMLGEQKKFPDLKKLPKYSKPVLSIDNEDVLAVAKAASVFEAGHRASLIVKDGKAIFRVFEQELGSFTVRAGDCSYKDTVIGLDTDYLLTIEALSGKVDVQIKDNKSALRLVDEKGRIYWLSPVLNVRQ